MAKRNPLEDVYGLISDIMGFIGDKELDLREGKPSEELRQQVDMMKFFVMQYKELIDKMIAESGVNPDSIVFEKNYKEAASKKDARLLKRLADVKEELIQRKQQLSQVIEKAQAGGGDAPVKDETKMADTGKGEKQEKKKRKRKKKFRGMGGDKWMKM